MRALSKWSHNKSQAIDIRHQTRVLSGQHAFSSKIAFAFGVVLVGAGCQHVKSPQSIGFVRMPDGAVTCRIIGSSVDQELSEEIASVVLRTCRPGSSNRPDVLVQVAVTARDARMAVTEPVSALAGPTALPDKASHTGTEYFIHVRAEYAKDGKVIADTSSSQFSRRSLNEEKAHTIFLHLARIMAEKGGKPAIF